MQQFFLIAIKQRMEKDIDEVGKIARQAKTKVDELEKDVCSCLTHVAVLQYQYKLNSPMLMIDIIKISYNLVNHFAGNCMVMKRNLPMLLVI